MKKLLHFKCLFIILAVVSLLLVNCQQVDDFDKEGKDAVVSPIENPATKITGVEVPTTIKTNEDSFLKLDMEANKTETVFYKITATDEENNFVPNSGIIVMNGGKGILTSLLNVPKATTNTYTVTLTNAQNKVTTQTFTIKVTD